MLRIQQRGYNPHSESLVLSNNDVKLSDVECVMVGDVALLNSY